MDGVSSNEESEKRHNYYFGMRYDVTFKIGDYKGPLDYTFTVMMIYGLFWMEIKL